MRTISRILGRGAATAALAMAALSLSGCALLGPSYRPEPVAANLADELALEGRFVSGRGYFGVLPPPEAALSAAGRREAVVFYPGGKVKPLAYLPLWELVSRAGYAVYAPSMPLDLAVFKIGAAASIRKALPPYEAWHIAGHSLGGAMAAEHIKKGETDYKSLILLGSYPADKTDLSALPIAVLSIREEFGLPGGTEKARALRANLPPGHVFIMLPGGNHAQFGRYGVQKGDGKATISPEEQAAAAAAWIVEFLRGL